MRKLPILVFLILVVAFPVELNAWVYDTHYYFTFGAALSTCFDWDEAHLIASAAVMIDRNKETKAESDPIGKRKKREWHAFGHSTERYVELWERVLDEPDSDLQLVYFGQFLHYLQDWESHAGFGLSLGHAVATVTGNDPDSLGLSEQRTQSQMQSTIDHMGQLCAHLDRLPPGTRDSDEALVYFVGDYYLDTMVDDLIITSDPAWRRGRTGGMSKIGKRIVGLNAARIEQFIEENLKRIPEKKIPADFRANSESSGIPRWITLDFDGEGNLRTAIEAARAEDVELLEPGDLDDVLTVLEAQPTTEGFRVKVRGHNTAETRSEKGELFVVVSDAESGEELGSVSREIPEVEPGAKVYWVLEVPTSGVAQRTMISATATVEDFTTIDSFNMLLSKEDVEALEQAYLAELEEQARADEQAEIEIGLVEEPKVWTTWDRWLCTVVVARAEHSDPTRVLEPVQIDFVGPDGNAVSIPPYSPRWWGITPAGRGQPPAVKAYECFPPVDYCPAMGEGPELPDLRFRLEAGVGSREATVALDGQLGQDVLRACSESRAAGFPEQVRPLVEVDDSFRVLTLNVWHGLRSGESKTKFPGEDAERNQRRFNWQVSEIYRHRPDVMFFQEVNKAPKEARAYATVFGYDEIYKVASCGIHLGKVIKIPKNVNEGLAILARPDLNLRRVGKKKLSGDAACTGTFGFQTKESRYVLFGEITVAGYPVLLAVTHLSSPRDVPPGFEEQLLRLVEEGKLLEEQRVEIVEKLESGRARNLRQVEKLLAQIEKQRRRMTVGDWVPPVILAGDFNAQPDSPGVRLVKESGFDSIAIGPDFLTWDPVTNHENHEIGTRRKPPVPTFDIPEIEELLEPRYTTARQIDYIFVKGNAKMLTAEMVMTEDLDGLYPSDHFGILTTLDWREPPRAP
jgi:endonuclease/exonuclease/phosphatase family metal-dependent hydrolase